VKLAAFAFALFSCLAHARESAQVEVAFTPGDDIEGLIVREIARARATIQVQAYLFTDRHVATALVGALRRGVAVDVAFPCSPACARPGPASISTASSPPRTTRS
jgi:phosphatidylserine/phosphatidylglycerophosphate/cardiolipin synthase-like enzyme